MHRLIEQAGAVGELSFYLKKKGTEKGGGAAENSF